MKKNRSKYSLLSVFITKVAVVAISAASVSAAHPGSPPPDCTASGQRFAICDWSACTASGQISAFARFLVNFSGGWQPRPQTWQTACQTTQTTCCAMRRLATSLTNRHGLTYASSQNISWMLHASGSLSANQSVLVPSHPPKTKCVHVLRNQKRRLLVRLTNWLRRLCQFLQLRNHRNQMRRLRAREEPNGLWPGVLFPKDARRCLRRAGQAYT